MAGDPRGYGSVSFLTSLSPSLRASTDHLNLFSSSHTPIYSARGGRGGGRGGGFVGSGHKSSMESFEPDKPLPPGYICYRCGQRGACLLPSLFLCFLFRLRRSYLAGIADLFPSRPLVFLEKVTGSKPARQTKTRTLTTGRGSSARRVFRDRFSRSSKLLLGRKERPEES
jgi:hypothetical protein